MSVEKFLGIISAVKHCALRIHKILYGTFLEPCTLLHCDTGAAVFSGVSSAKRRATVALQLIHIHIHTKICIQSDCKSKCMRRYRQVHVHLSLYTKPTVYNLKSIANNEINRPSEALQQTHQQ